MRNAKVIVVLLMIVHISAFGQPGLDSFLQQLDNKNAQIGFHTRPFTAQELGVNPGNPAPTIKSHVVIMSLDVDSLAALYPKDLLVRRLVPLLKDPNKDFYANAILYALFEMDMPPLNTRKNWLKTTAKKDIRYWNEYIRQNDLHL